eukprot:gene15333-20663_t
MGACLSCLKRIIGGSRSRNQYETISDREPTKSPSLPLVQLQSQNQSRNASFQGSDSKILSDSLDTESIPIPLADNWKDEHLNSPSTASSINIIPQQTKSAFFLQYDLRDEIGIGSTSKCYKCIRKKDNQEFACKVIDKRQVEMKFSGLLDQFFVEIKVLQSLNHPNIIRLEDTFESPDRIYMVMEVMKGGELFDYVVEKGTLSEEEASLLVRKITSAVAHMHGMNIIHRDLKPENLLLTNKGPSAEVKLIDFGLAKVMRETVASSFLGTKGYLAPEMLQRHSYDKAIDMWALGVIVFVLLCGCLPFDDDSSRIPSESVARKKFALRFPKWAASLSSSAKDLLHNLLEINPKERFTAEQALSHPWVSGKTVLPNSYLQSPCVLSERRRELRSPPVPPNYIQHTHDRLMSGYENGNTQKHINGGNGKYRNGKSKPGAGQGYDGELIVNKVRKNSF